MEGAERIDAEYHVGEMKIVGVVLKFQVRHFPHFFRRFAGRTRRWPVGPELSVSRGGDPLGETGLEVTLQKLMFFPHFATFVYFFFSLLDVTPRPTLG